MCWIDCEPKKIIHLQYLILETLYILLFIFSWHFSFMPTEHSITMCFQVLTTVCSCFAQVYRKYCNIFVVFIFTVLKKKLFLDIFSIDLRLF